MGVEKNSCAVKNKGIVVAGARMILAHLECQRSGRGSKEIFIGDLNNREDN